MSQPPAPEITWLLKARRAADEGALDRSTLLVSGELGRLAHASMRHAAPGQTLHTPAHINKACLRLVEARGVARTDRYHSFALFARAVRHLLVDAARAVRRPGDSVAGASG